MFGARLSGSEGKVERARKAAVYCFSAGRKPPSMVPAYAWHPAQRVIFEKRNAVEDTIYDLLSFFSSPSLNELSAPDHAPPSNLGSVYR
jgi:hypothetical protein